MWQFQDPRFSSAFDQVSRRLCTVTGFVVRLRASGSSVLGSPQASPGRRGAETSEGLRRLGGNELEMPQVGSNRSSQKRLRSFAPSKTNVHSPDSPLPQAQVATLEGLGTQVQREELAWLLHSTETSGCLLGPREGVGRLWENLTCFK